MKTTIDKIENNKSIDPKKSEAKDEKPTADEKKESEEEDKAQPNEP